MITPQAADAVRKVVGYGLAVALTVLLFRVLGRTANGRQALAEPELIVLVVLTSVAIAWVRAARRVRRAAPHLEDARPEDPPRDDPPAGS